MTKPTIDGFAVNACFPRSGHRMLREILMRYFADEFVFYDPYEKIILCSDVKNRSLGKVNYLKTHDFKLSGTKVSRKFALSSKKHLAQVRNPLDSMASYYEFSLKHRLLRSDSQSSWNAFFKKNLQYWMNFCELWLESNLSSRLVVSYERLVSEPEKTASEVIRYLGGASVLDQSRLNRAVEAVPFHRHVGEESSERSESREIREFRYYCEEEFREAEKRSLKDSYLALGIIKHFDEIA